MKPETGKPQHTKINQNVPDELAELFDEYSACIQCRNEAIKSIWSYKRAAYYGRLAIIKRREFWTGVRRVWPEYQNNEMSYDIDTKILTITIQKNCSDE